MSTLPRLLTTAVAFAAMTALGFAAPAQAASKPAAPSDVRISVTTTSVKISWDRAARASYYRVCLMTHYNTHKCYRSTKASKSRTATFTGLSSTPGADFVARVFAYRGKSYAGSRKVRIDLPVARAAHLRPATWDATSLTATWAKTQNADTYQVQIATSLDMKSNPHWYTTKELTYRFGGLDPATTYWFRVRGLNNGVKGIYSYRNIRMTGSDPVPMTVTTFNTCGGNHCRDEDGKDAINRWSKVRRAYAAELATKVGPMIIAAQETPAAADFEVALPSQYKIASYKSAKSLYYDSRYLRVLRHSYITLRTGSRYAAYAEFEHMATGTRFVVIDVHTSPHKGQANDEKRKQEMYYLIRGEKRVNPEGLPVIFAGDFNSNSNNIDRGGFDAVHDAFAAEGIPDVATLTSDLRNWNINSYNGGVTDMSRRARDHIDRFFLKDGRASGPWVVSWAEIVVDLLDTGLYRTPFASDHNPVGVSLTVPGFAFGP